MSARAPRAPHLLTPSLSLRGRVFDATISALPRSVPDAQHAPAGAAEGAGDVAVAGLVAGELCFPEFRVGLGLRGVDREKI